MSSSSVMMIRADASEAIGLGHVMRCLALAQAWQDRGGRALFASCEMPDSLVARLNEEDIGFRQIKAEPGSREDLQQTLEILATSAADSLVLDGYRFGDSFQFALESLPVVSLTIDDMDQLPTFRTDFVLNQNVVQQESLYRNLSSKTRLLLGPVYSLIRRELRSCEGRYRKRSGEAHHLLVTMGGSDPAGATVKVAEGLAKLSHPELRIRVIAGDLNRNLRLIREQIEHDSRFELLVSPCDMGIHYAWADFAITAGGSSNWELCAFGVPRLVWMTADNQKHVVETLVGANVAISLSSKSSITPDHITAMTSELLCNPESLQRMQIAAKQLVDGEGAARCVELVLAARDQEKAASASAFLGSRSEKEDGVILRYATINDAELLLAWRNDPLTRESSRNTRPVDAGEHRAWLLRSLSSDQRVLWIAERNGIAIGTVRLDRGEISELSWTIAPEFRGQGLGRRVVALAIATTNEPLLGVIKDTNMASRRLAEALGFQLRSQDGEWLSYIRDVTENRS